MTNDFNARMDTLEAAVVELQEELAACRTASSVAADEAGEAITTLQVLTQYELETVHGRIDSLWREVDALLAAPDGSSASRDAMREHLMVVRAKARREPLMDRGVPCDQSSSLGGQE